MRGGYIHKSRRKLRKRGSKTSKNPRPHSFQSYKSRRNTY